jgi:hypothetical protein
MCVARAWRVLGLFAHRRIVLAHFRLRRIEQKFGVMSGNPVVRRIRYYNIAPDRFSWVSDLSKDGGRTWEKDNLQIEAGRIGAARSLKSLAPARNKPDVR